MEQALDAQLDNWLMGLKNEIFFWKHFMKERGGRFRKGFAETVEKNKRFLLEDELANYSRQDKVKFIDVGSGPFSRCGFVTDKVKLECVACDPLADVYIALKNKYQLDNGIQLKSGFVELLDKEFAENSFDIVHMSNALDHSFNPIIGISQLLFICKIGGKVILRHNENEAENENYQGLHQWNLSTKNIENGFVIWRDTERYNICELFKDYAEIQIKEDSLESQFTRVEMIKKKSITIPENNLYDSMLLHVYPYLLQVLYMDVNKNDVGILPYMKRIKKQIGKCFK